MRHNYRWFFGNRLSLDFNSGPQATTGDSHLCTLEGSASVCDPVTGGLLFYTDGVHVWDRNHVLQADDLKGQASATTSAVIVPRPGSTDRFFIINPGETSGVEGFEDASGRIDLSLPVSFAGPTRGIHVTEVKVGPAGLSFPSGKNVPLLYPDPQGATTEKLAVTVQPNCRDYWLVTGHETTFYVYQITDLGIEFSHSVEVENRMSPLGYLKFSPGGERLAVANFDMRGAPLWGHPPSLLVYDFNPNDGAIDGAQPLGWEPWSGLGSPYGLEFSPSGELLYVSLSRPLADQTKKVGLLQVDLSGAAPVVHLVKAIGTTAPLSTFPPRGRPGVSGVPHVFAGIGALLRSPLPGGPIYVAMPGTRALGAILHPEVRVIQDGDALCGFDEQAVAFDDLVFWGLPTLVEYGDCTSEGCQQLLAQVNTTLNQACTEMANTMAPCDGEDPEGCGCTTDQGDCAPLDLPEIVPCISVRWGREATGQVPAEGTEVVCITVCNCFSNVTFKRLNVAMLEVVDHAGDPVSGPITVTPIGPYAFGDVEPCSCVSRQFVLQTHGAEPGTYRIRIRGICFDVCLHYNLDDCVRFNVG